MSAPPTNESGNEEAHVLAEALIRNAPKWDDNEKPVDAAVHQLWVGYGIRVAQAYLDLEAVVCDYEAWLGAALLALGVKTVFDIPNWRENLSAAVRLNEEEREEAERAMAEERL